MKTSISVNGFSNLLKRLNFPITSKKEIFVSLFKSSATAINTVQANCFSNDIDTDVYVHVPTFITPTLHNGIVTN